MNGCGYRKKRGCANCGHHHEGRLCGRWMHRKGGWFDRCPCRTHRERPSRAVPWRARLLKSCPSPHLTKKRIDAFERKHQREMQLKLIDERRKP